MYYWKFLTITKSNAINDKREKSNDMVINKEKKDECMKAEK
jgi:hypothetical protein